MVGIVEDENEAYFLFYFPRDLRRKKHIIQLIANVNVNHKIGPLSRFSSCWVNFFNNYIIEIVKNSDNKLLGIGIIPSRLIVGFIC